MSLLKYIEIGGMEQKVCLDLRCSKEVLINSL